MPSRPTAIPGAFAAARAGKPWLHKAAQTQRLLWASTSTKNPAYRDVLYIEELIGPGHGEHHSARHVGCLPRSWQSAPHLEDDLAAADKTMTDLERPASP